MSTRANILLKDRYDNQLWFYRHSDGYPDGALPILKTFMQAITDGKIRDNLSQAGGWLILLGAEEYEIGYRDFDKNNPGDYHKHWKCGAIEPTTDQHGDIEYLYTLDLGQKTIKIHDMYDKTDVSIQFTKTLT